MMRLRERRSRYYVLDWSEPVRIGYQSEVYMADKVRILWVLVNHAGEYLTRKNKFTSDFAKARIYTRRCDATNSSYFCNFPVFHRKVVLVDPTFVPI